jgi:8-amino-7-oxononanoate synthase
VLEAVAGSEGVASTGSRLLSGNSSQWEEIESEFACFAGTETAIYFGSGYAAPLASLTWPTIALVVSPWENVTSGKRK